MKLVIIGAVAAGTSAAAKARRNNETTQITVYEKDVDISYSGCTMPYYLGGLVTNSDDLTPRDSKYFKDTYNINIITSHEVMAIDSVNKQLTVKNLLTDQMFIDTYDKLIIATGATSIVPPIKGVQQNHVFSLRNIRNMYQIDNFIKTNKPKSAVVVGTGFIGLELAENMTHLGICVTMVEKMNQVSPGLDIDMAIYVENHLKENGVIVKKNANVVEIDKNNVLLEDGTAIKGELVIIATGVKPNTKLAKECGIELGRFGGITVNNKMETSIKDIYACGDSIEQFHVISGKPTYRPLGSTANKTGRIAGNNATGGNMTFKGVLGTAIYKVFDLAVAQTGYTEKEALNEGYEIIISHNIKPNKPEYLGGKELIIKTIADKSDGRILGAQIIGPQGVDRRIDVFATAITFKATAENLMDLDLSYAPPFSTSKDPVMYSGMIINNALKYGRTQYTAKQIMELIQSDKKYTIIDTRSKLNYEKGHIPTSINIPLVKFRDEIGSIDKDQIIITYCNKGITGNATQNILINLGFKQVYSLSGGYKTFVASTKSNV